VQFSVDTVQFSMQTSVTNGSNWWKNKVMVKPTNHFKAAYFKAITVIDCFKIKQT
jgi:hypothetical protein